ncbi:pre-terminal protein [Egyptian fruit bat adenovirus]|uniref:Preterminal protein n=1 Tax=Egyptian fruit bat adenovirus TaxID=2849732 RepID=A0A344X9U3_9ADEN|nr:pre-terminal protein [Rousettus aegyptiacus adenovirus]AXE75625.1 pre-terminal protein [Egyptian fruit bat adenovirus]
MDYARLTGQSVYTIEVFRPIRNIFGRVRLWARPATTAQGIAWMSKYIYKYPQLMLMNLSPRAPATLHWPLFNYPPPHFLIGYQYIVRVCNDYIFDNRAYSKIKYHEIQGPMQQLINWSMLANCSYNLNTAAYHRFLDFENFQETLTQIQQSILADRIVADLGMLQPFRGYGVTSIEEQRNVPVHMYLQQQRRNMAETNAWGMAERIRIEQAGQSDVIILQTIRQLKAAYFNYLLSNNDISKLSLPCDCNWIQAFVSRFSDPLEPTSLSQCNIPVQNIIKAVLSALSLPNSTPFEISGGAFELRPRENGRAVTEEMRRRRGENVLRFIESLPLPTRRRRRPPPASVSPSIAEEAEEEEIEEPLTFDQEVRQAIAEVIRLLEDELSVQDRNERFFNFTLDFYQSMHQLDVSGEISEITLRRWVLYFFIVEHIASTLNYLHHGFRIASPFTRYVDLNLAQVILRTRDNLGNVIYNRLWTEYGQDSFINLMTRISPDLATSVQRAGLGEVPEEELDQFMADIAYHDNSGDVEEVLKQVAMNDAEIDSVELSFRFKFTGPVVLSQHPEIQTINRRVVNLASQLRAQRQALPQHNQAVQLPPL